MRDRFRSLILFGAALLILTAGFGLRDPWPPNEPENALAAAEMLSSGDWLAPTLAGELFVKEGPLYLWILAVFQWLFGMRIGFLLPSLLAGIGMLWMTCDLGPPALGRCRRFLGRGRNAGLRAVRIAGARRRGRRGVVLLHRVRALRAVPAPFAGPRLGPFRSRLPGLRAGFADRHFRPVTAPVAGAVALGGTPRLAAEPGPVEPQVAGWPCSALGDSGGLAGLALGLRQ